MTEQPYIAKLIVARDRVNAEFLYYSSPSTMTGNTNALANLALIGGRLDKLIRDEGDRARKDARYRASAAVAQARDHANPRTGTPPEAPVKAAPRLTYWEALKAWAKQETPSGR